MESSSSPTFLTTTSLDKRKPSPVSRNPPKQKRKTTTSTNKPIKVRYISNPMKVSTCASKFRELVQELTGQDAVDLQLEPEFSPSAVSDHSPSPQPENLAPPRVLDQEPFDDIVADYYEPLDGEEMYLPQMSAGFSGFFSNGFYNVNDFGRIDSM
uniref:Sigma factor binding protein 1, chloroplastic n=2 Tax=Noccaea caerulescens TaxID=107243 RepID=A0A1J3H8B7_NOCCA